MQTPVAFSPNSVAAADTRLPVASLDRQRERWRAVPLAMLSLLTLLPVGFVLSEVAEWVRNIPRWDEFDTVLDFLVSLDAGAEISEVAARVAAVQNEHRMVVSRSIFAASYWLFDGVNFALLAALGNLFLLVASGVLVLGRGTTAARLRLAAILALVVYQLQHYENLFWGGASIDHFFVVTAAFAALLALTRTGGTAIAAACGGGLLATFSLAHGMIVWPVGLLLLARERRWRAAGVWLGAAAVAAGLFLWNFSLNPAHRLPGLADFWSVMEFWLTLIGSSAALDDVTIAPWLGAGFVAATLGVLRRGWDADERVLVGAIVWCLGAMGAVAWGRALLSSEWMPVTSRYYILSSLAWACLAGVVIERVLQRWPRCAIRWLPATFGGLVVFNVAANLGHLEQGRELARSSELAVRDYWETGTFARSANAIYPDPARADLLVGEAGRRGFYNLPTRDELTFTLSEPVALEKPTEIDDAVYFIDEVKERDGEMYVRGWAFRPDHLTRAGEMAVVFRSENGLVAFEPMQCLRPDVAEAYERWDAAYAGFELRLPESELPAGRLAIGVCFDARDEPEYMMTANTVMVPRLVIADSTAR